MLTYFVRVTLIPAASAAARIFPDRPHVEAGLGPVQIVSGSEGSDDAEIDKRIVGEEQLARGRQIAQAGDRDAAHMGGNRLRQLEGFGFGPADHQHPDEVGKPLPEDGQGQAGHVLIGQEGDGQHRVDQRGEHPARKAAMSAAAKLSVR